MQLPAAHPLPTQCQHGHLGLWVLTGGLRASGPRGQSRKVAPHLGQCAFQWASSEPVPGTGWREGSAPRPKLLMQCEQRRLAINLLSGRCGNQDASVGQTPSMQ